MSLRALIVDDNQMMREIVGRFMSSLGYKVESVCNGQEAVDNYGEQSYDVILSDVEMPEKDGITAMKEIRERNPEQYIVMMSGAHNGDLKQLASNYCNIFLDKPVKYESLKDLFQP